MYKTQLGPKARNQTHNCIVNKTHATGATSSFTHHHYSTMRGRFYLKTFHGRFLNASGSNGVENRSGSMDDAIPIEIRDTSHYGKVSIKVLGDVNKVIGSDF